MEDRLDNKPTSPVLAERNGFEVGQGVRWPKILSYDLPEVLTRAGAGVQIEDRKALLWDMVVALGALESNAKAVDEVIEVTLAQVGEDYLRKLKAEVRDFRQKLKSDSVSGGSGGDNTLFSHFTQVSMANALKVKLDESGYDQQQGELLAVNIAKEISLVEAQTGGVRREVRAMELKDAGKDLLEAMGLSENMGIGGE